MLHFFLSLIFGLFTQAHAGKSDISPNLKWDLEVREVSRKFRKDYYPKELVDAWWAAPEYNHKSGLLKAGGPRSWRHAHAMVVAAFWAKRKDHRDTARTWLKEYECENVVACDDVKHFYDGALMANVLTLNGEEKAEAESVRTSLGNRAAAALNRKPPTSGLCSPDADRAGWLALEYEIFCPSPGTPSKYGLCAGCELTKDLALQLGIDSQQMVLSSSFLDKLEHRGSASCAKPWKTSLRCGGGIDATYTVSCERKADGVDCREKRKTTKK